MDPMEGLQAAMAAVDAYYKERGLFQGRFGFGVSPALIVIDMAYGWTDAEYAAGSARLESAIAAIRQLLPVAREKEIPVIYTTAPFRERAKKSVEEGSPRLRPWDRRACEIDERLRPLPAETIIHKCARQYPETAADPVRQSLFRVVSVFDGISRGAGGWRRAPGMALARAHLSAAPSIGHGAKVHGRLRAARHAAARHPSRAGGGPIAVAS
jgi:hypothetical protein